MVEHGWTLEGITRWVTACIDLFGPQRCIFGTNWPVDRFYSSYAELIGAYRQILSRYSDGEQRAMFVNVAADLYRIALR
jgi:predicted TIM-barrel fold metal-dependent hydrolase